MAERVRVAVRPLVEYVFRSGSLDGEFRSAASLTEGTRAHQAIQKEYGEADRSEVYVSGEFERGELVFEIDGRCDGVRTGEDGSVAIEEIKSTAGDVALIEEESYPVHWAQAYCYACLYVREHGLDRIRVQLTYVQVESGQQKRFLREASAAELESFVADVLDRYAPWALLTIRRRKLRDESIAALPFPYREYRKGQRKLAGAVYRSIEAGTGLFARAPTGIGKTMSTVFPSVKAMGQGHLQQIFYLTAKSTTRASAEDAFSRLRAEGLRLQAVTITAKEKICFRDQVDCRAQACEFADGYYDRINGALLDLLSSEDAVDRGAIEKYARKHRVCPFEMSLDAAYAADAVICDYNYVFDPRVSLKRMLAEKKSHTVLLVDEAHNLPDRAREMYSAELDKRSFLQLEREHKAANPALRDAAKAVNRLFIGLRKRGNGRSYSFKDKPEELLLAAETFASEAEKALASRQGAPSGDDLLLETYFAASAFVRIGKLYDERYAVLVDCSGHEVRAKLLCLDPSEPLRQTGKGFKSRVFFSATLSPLGFYMDVLGAKEDDYSVSISSPFDPGQWDVSVRPLSTRYADRERSVGPIARLLGELLERRRGRYLFFFPSYAFMNDVYAAFAAGYDGKFPTLLQEAGMSEPEREAFLARFSEDAEETLAGFAVLGGAFSEGVDLVGDRLTGVVVVGVGLPQLGPERELIREYYEAATGRGFEYAYVIPGMNKVLQAGGRLIRSETDTGALVLVDDRYLQPAYRRLLPEEWRI